MCLYISRELQEGNDYAPEIAIGEVSEHSMESWTRKNRANCPRRWLMSTPT